MHALVLLYRMILPVSTLKTRLLALRVTHGPENWSLIHNNIAAHGPKREYHTVFCILISQQLINDHIHWYLKGTRLSVPTLASHGFDFGHWTWL